jgi:hypothetical protein
MTNLLENKISISYRRDDFASYMIIKIEDEEAIINYQTEMITNNKIPRLLQVDIRRKDNKACFYYNITSKIPLSQFLNRRKITKEELMAILVQITETMLAGMNFLLYNKCFILQEKYIYINPATNEISLLYLPVSYDTGVKMSLRNFVINLIVYSADIDDENTSDNYIQKILNYAKCETFNIADFNKLLVRMCAEDVEKVRQEDDEPLEEKMKEINYDNLSFKHRQNLYRQEVVKNKISSFIIAGISQLIILAFKNVVFPDPAPPQIKMLYFAITTYFRKSAASWLIESNSISFSIVTGVLGNFLIVITGPFRAMGFNTTFTLEPSCSVASTIGEASFTTLFAFETTDWIISSSFSSLSSLISSLYTLPPFSTKILSGPFIIISVTE